MTENSSVYRERACLVAFLAAVYPSHIGYTDPDAPDWKVVTVETPEGQMCWHIAPEDLSLFAGVRPTDSTCRGWDGHTTEEKYDRLASLARIERALDTYVTRELYQGLAEGDS